jgi:aryl-alcohol dehydrogenase-like predicted oxidoreductase
MEFRRLGRRSLVVSALGLGCMGMSDFYGPHEDNESLATIHRAMALGVTLLDTSDAYGMRHNEILVGQAIAGRRNEVVVATKFGIQRAADGAFLGVNGRPEYVAQCCDASLKRLQISSIDLYYLHRVDPSVPIEDTVGAMSRLVGEGKVRYLGLSEAAPATLRRAFRTHPIAALQTEYSLWSREPEDEILGACRELGIGFVAYSPLGRGFLAGKFRSPEDFHPSDFRRHSPRFLGENFDRNLQPVGRINQMASEKHCKPAQLALAWVLAQGGDIVPIPGTKRVSYLEENLGALSIELSSDDLARIAELLPKGSASGLRYPEFMMNSVNL